MRKLKFVFQIIIAFIVALAAYSGLYQPNAESVRAAVKNNLPQSMQQRAGKPVAPSMRGQAATSNAPAGATRSRFCSTSICSLPLPST